MVGDAEIKNPLETFLGYQLRRASAVVMPDLVAQYEALDVRLSEGSVVILIEQNPGINQSAIGKMLDIQRANMAPLIAKLIKQALVERRPIDGRSFGLHLSKRGKSLANTLMALSVEHDARLIAALPEKARSDFIETLESLRRAWAPAAGASADGDDDEGTAGG